MYAFKYHTGIVLPLDISNIDTDSIIPKQFLKETKRINFGKYLFFNWRYTDNTASHINKNFIFNHPNYNNATILLTRKNFGCGSSREHAVWALIDYGFKIIVAPSFSDIFYKNSFNNRLLLAILSDLEIDSLFQELYLKNKKPLITVNLYYKTIYTKNQNYSFKINNFYRNYMLNNLDQIGLTLKYEKNIQKYENKQLSFFK